MGEVEVDPRLFEEEFGVMKKSIRSVKIVGKCGIKVVKNWMGIIKDVVTFNWI